MVFGPDLTKWWLDEIATDPAYETVVTPLLHEILEPQPDHVYLDIGCGQGRVMRSVSELGARVVGVDASEELGRLAPNAVVAEVPPLPISSDAFDGAYLVLTLEHIVDIEGIFEETARVVTANGVLAIVSNHPVWTAPDSTPISDTNGETLWRSGDYFGSGSSEVPTPSSSVVFHHRSMAVLLNSASKSGWRLEQMIERPHHEFDDQGGIPRLLACRWRLLP